MKYLGMLLAGLMLTGMASATPCGPVTVGKSYSIHDDGTGPNFLIYVNGQKYQDGQLAVVPTNNNTVGAVEVFGFVDVFGGISSGCTVVPNPWNWAMVTNVVIGDWSESCSGSFPQCYEGHPVIWSDGYQDSGQQNCSNTASCKFDLTDGRDFAWNSWVTGHSYRIYAFMNADVGTQGVSCSGTPGPYSGCIANPNGGYAYWAFVGVYVQ